MLEMHGLRNLIYAILLLSTQYSYCAAQQSAPWERVEVVPKQNNSAENPYRHIRRVSVVVKSYCPECEKVMNFLSNREIQFTKRQIYVSASDLTGTLLPIDNPPITTFTFVDGSEKKVLGYDEEMLKQITGNQPISGSGAAGFDLAPNSPDNSSDSFDLR